MKKREINLYAMSYSLLFSLFISYLMYGLCLPNNLTLVSIASSLGSRPSSEETIEARPAWFPTLSSGDRCTPIYRLRNFRWAGPARSLAAYVTWYIRLYQL